MRALSAVASDPGAAAEAAHYSKRCASLTNVFLRDAATLEAERQTHNVMRDRDGLTAEQNFACALYYEAIGDAIKAWQSMGASHA